MVRKKGFAIDTTIVGQRFVADSIRSNLSIRSKAQYEVHERYTNEGPHSARAERIVAGQVALARPRARGGDLPTALFLGG